jgi:3-oxoacyl-[acyl-carrier-protein] synthase II
MPACHIAIAHDARGPCNSLVLGEVSSLLAIREAARVIERGAADAIVAGGTGYRLHPTTYLRSSVEDVSKRNDDPAGACRPFAQGRDGLVNGEGAAMFLLESRESAQARGARIWASILGTSSCCEPRRPGGPRTSKAVARSFSQALADAGLSPADVGHVNAHGMSTIESDRLEAEAIRAVLGETPVTAPKSYFGHLGAGGGAVEMAASVLALAQNYVPRTLNHEQPAEDCPIRVIDREPLVGAKPVALVTNQAITGQSAAIVLGGG